MTMTKKDYEKVAAVLRKEREHWEGHDVVLLVLSEVLTRIAGGLATVFAADNQRFDRAKFLEAARAERRVK